MTGVEYEAIDAAAALCDAGLIALRRDIHRRPELAGREERTAALVADRLRAAGLDVRTGVGGHGVVGVLDGAGTTATFPAEPFPAMVCSPELSDAAAAHLRADPCVDTVLTLHAAWPFNGEDFALFLHRVPGAMLFLGVGPGGIPHAPGFVADERAIGVGVRAMAGLLLRRLRAA